VYINYINSTIGSIECLEDGRFKIEIYDDYKKALKYFPYPHFVDEGIYEKLPKKIEIRLPKKNSQQERFLRELFSYRGKSYNPLYWLALTKGVHSNSLYNFSEEIHDRERMSAIVHSKQIELGEIPDDRYYMEL